MSSLAYTSGNPTSLVSGATANMVDISGPFSDIRTWANGNVDSVNTTPGPVLLQTAQAWQTLALTGFTTSLSYMKDGFGFVHLRGDALTTTGSPPGASAALGTLPAGYRPVNTQYVRLMLTTGGANGFDLGWSITSAGVITNLSLLASTTGYAVVGGPHRGEN